VAKSVKDLIALASAQTSQDVQAIYGLARGNMIGFMMQAARFNFPETTPGGDFFGQTVEAYVDGSTKSVGLTFIY